jgi:hypothetical protein
MTTRPSGQWITYERAASILGCHISNVPKLIRKGELTSSRRSSRRNLLSLDQAEVEALAERRRLAREALAARPRRRYG